MDIFNPTDIEGPDQVRAYANGVWGFLRELEQSPHQGSLCDHMRAVQMALATVVRGNRGVGAVIRIGDQGRVAEGANTVQEKDNDWMHVGHAEVNAITAANMRFRGQMRELAPTMELISSLGPCPMCMCAIINRKIAEVTTLMPDCTGGITLAGMAQAFPGYRKHIEEERIRYRQADLSAYPDGIGDKLSRVAWALSRISAFSFNRAEFEEGLEKHQAMGNR